jgi:hypothetical protein
LSPLLPAPRYEGKTTPKQAADWRSVGWPEGATPP